MTGQTLIKGFIAVALGAQVFGLTPSVLNDCQAQEGRPTVHQLKKPTWVALGGQFQRGLSVVTNQSGSSITVFGAGSDNGRWTIESANNGTTWGSFTGHQGALFSAPACDRDDQVANPGIRCFWTNGGSLWNQFQKANGSDEEFLSILGKKIASDPSFVSGWLYVHRADDNALWAAHTKLGKLTGEWESMGGELKGGPSCIEVGRTAASFSSTGYQPIVQCYAVGTDDAVWAVHGEQHSVGPIGVSQTEYVWKKIGGQAIGGVSASLRGSGGTALAVRGTDSTLWLVREVDKPGKVLGADFKEVAVTVHTGEFGTWENFPGKIASVPACSHSYCFAILPDGQLGFLNLTGRL